MFLTDVIKKGIIPALLRKHYRGFSLLETSIALLIAGLISSMIMIQMKGYQNFVSAHKTQSNMEIVISSLAAYCCVNNTLPFPSGDQGNKVGISDPNLKNTFGIVPFKTLGIMEKFAKDGRGRWITYRMNPYFGESFSPPWANDIGVQSFSSSSGDKVAFVIRSIDETGNTQQEIWYSENNFKAKFGINISSQTQQSFIVDD